MSVENSEKVVVPLAMWLLILAVIFGAIGTFVWLVFAGAMGNTEQRYFRLQVPGSMELPGLAAGRYTIYHEFDKSADGTQDLRPPGFERIRFSVTPIAGGPGPAVVEAQRKSTFVIRRTVCESMLQFEVEQQDNYRINGDFDSGQVGGTYRVAVGRPYHMEAIRNFVIGTVILIAAGLLVSYLLYRSGAVRPALPNAEA